MFTAQEAEAMLSARMQVTGMDGCVEVVRLRGGDLLSHQLHSSTGTWGMGGNVIDFQAHFLLWGHCGWEHQQGGLG